MKTTILTIASVAAFATTSYAQNLLLNGSFESYPGGESVATAPDLFINGNFANWDSGIAYAAVGNGLGDGFYAPSDGNVMVLAIQGGIQLSQSFTTEIGQQYQLTFDYAGGAQFDNDGNAFFTGNLSNGWNVSVAGTSNNFFNSSRFETGTPAPIVGFDNGVLNFTATDTTTTLAFTSLGPASLNSGSSLLDNASVVAIPEPSSTALLGLGALGLLIRRKR